jgi:RNA polymerase II subunit A small phosphatase-like protein
MGTGRLPSLYAKSTDPSRPAHILPGQTAGLTSAAVVPPGSGSLIHSHAHPSQSSSHAPTPTATTPQLQATDGAGSPDESFSATESEVSGSDAGGQRYEDSQAEGGELYHHDDEEEEEDEDAHLLGGVGIPIGPDGKECPLLPPMATAHKGRKCLVLDLDETLLHSSFKVRTQAAAPFFSLRRLT